MLSIGMLVNADGWHLAADALKIIDLAEIAIARGK